MIRKIPFVFWILLSAVLACVFGFYWPEQASRFSLLGEIYLNALKMMILPLIVTSMVSGVAGLGSAGKLGGIGIRTFIYYFLTTALSVIVGIFLVLFIHPGNADFISSQSTLSAVPEVSYSFVEVLAGIIHPNLVQAAAELKILPIIFFSLLLGAAILSLGNKARGLADWFESLNLVVMKMVHWVMKFTPLGVFGLLASRLGEAGGGDAFWLMMTQLGAFCVTVIFGLGIHGVFILPGLYWIFTRKNPFQFLLYCSEALATAFATASSSATLPITMDCVTQKAGISKKTAGLVLPVGATINMDGTALYEAVAAVFIAQCYGMSLSAVDLVTIFLTATLAAIGAAGIPSAGLVTMVLVLESVGLPLEGIGMLLAIDWFLDRCRTTVNVWGDALGASIIDGMMNRVQNKSFQDNQTGA